MRVLATNVSTDLTATAFAAIILAGAAVFGLTPSATQAATMQDHACTTVGSQCGETTGTTPKKKTPNLAARALTNKVLMDVMLGNAKSNPELTVGCGVSGICVTLIPEQPSDPDDVGVPGILVLTSDSGSGPQSFASPPIDTAFIAGAPATSRFAARSNRVAAGPFASRAFSSSPANNPGSNPPGQNPDSPNPGDPGNQDGKGPPNGPTNGPVNDPGNPGGGDPDGGAGSPPGGDENPDDRADGPFVVEPPFIDVDQRVDAIRVPEPSTLFIFGFALLAMAAFGARQTQAATNKNQAKRARR